MTAEELQDQTLDNLLAAKLKQRNDRAATAAKLAAMNQAQVDRDAAFAAYQVKQQTLSDAGYAWYLARNLSEGEDVVAISQANQAFQDAMQNHGFVNG